MWAGTQPSFARGMLHIPAFSQQMGREGSGQHLPKAPARGSREHLDPFPDSFGFPAAPDVPQMSGMKPELLSPCRGTQGLPVHPPVLPVRPSAQLGAGSSPTLSTARFSSQKEGEIPPKAKYMLKLSFCGYLGMIQVCGSSPESHGKQGSLCFRCSSCST